MNLPVSMTEEFFTKHREHVQMELTDRYPQLMRDAELEMDMELRALGFEPIDLIMMSVITGGERSPFYRKVQDCIEAVNRRI